MGLTYDEKQYYREIFKVHFSEIQALFESDILDICKLQHKLKSKLPTYNDILKKFYLTTNKDIFAKMMRYFSKQIPEKTSNCFTIWGIRMRSKFDIDDETSLTDDEI